LELADKAAGTVKSYRQSCAKFVNFLLAEQASPIAADITPRHVKRFLAELRRAGSAASTVRKHYTALDQLFKYCRAEGAVPVSPTTAVTIPPLPLPPVPIVGAGDLQALLDTCRRGKSFTDRRDTAVIVFLLDTGCRVSELLGLRLSDVDVVTKRIEVLGKGRRVRHLAPGTKNVRAMVQYLRTRSQHPWATRTDRFWLGRQGPLTTNGVERMLARRCEQAGIAPINPHRFRHTFCHNWLAANLGETNLMYLAGWRSREMLSRYANSTVGDRARQAQLSHSPADRLIP